ncbi:MAG: Hsp70 family protein [Anaerolineae bacterium]|nr:Hsp70 family protein [Anaerolineae bacterium]
MKIGIDFGTTNTSVALVDEAGRVQVLPIDAAANSPTSMRTMLYIERDGDIHIGADAIHTYYAQNVGRVPRLTKQWVGEIEIVITEGGTVVLDAFTDVDADMPGRLLHSLKTPLASDYAGTTIFGKYYSLEALIAEFLRRVKARVVALTQREIDAVVFGRPVNFVGAANDADNQRAQARLADAARQAGFNNISFELEPIAAGLSYGDKTNASQSILVFDFGGGTLDVAIIRIAADGTQTVVATGGIGIAGDHFDQAVVRRALSPWFGQQVRWGPQRLALPAHMLGALGDWQDIQALATPPTLAFLAQAQRDCNDPMRLFALEDLIAKGYAYGLYERVERAKVALSRQRWTCVAYEAGEIALWQPLTRPQFESFIAHERRLIREMLLQTLERAGLPASAIDYVVRTGGSSSIPCFIELLTELFGPDRIVEQDLFTGVAAGLAIRAARG